MSDLIDRQATINAFFMELCFNKEREYAIGYKGIEKVINGLPSAEKTGKWIKLYRGNYSCSVCGAWYRTTDDYGNITDGKIEYNYCPNCGADMREVE